jgi:hypothetical protein
MRFLSPALLVAATALAVMAGPSRAFDDAEFCVAAKEFIRSVTADVGTWTDRFTRNDGVEVGCDLKTVHFKRFYKAPSSTLGEGWHGRQAAAWETAYCTRSIWSEAVGNGWVVSATVTTSTGERVWLACLPDGKGFFRSLP